MELVALRCPKCNGELEVHEGQKRTFCKYCGSQILLDDGNRIINVIILSMIASSIDSPITLRSFTTFLRSFFRLMSTNGAKCANVKDCPPYWLLAT